MYQVIFFVRSVGIVASAAGIAGADTVAVGDIAFNPLIAVGILPPILTVALLFDGNEENSILNRRRIIAV